MARTVKQLKDIGLLHRPAGVHHHHLVAQLRHHTKVVSDEDDGHARLGLQLFHQLQDLGLDGHIQRRGRLVTDEQVRLARERHGNHHPLAHTTRQIVRVDGKALGWLRYAHLLQHGDSRFLALDLAVLWPVEAKHFHQLITHRLHRVERRHRLLKDHRNTVAANLVHLIRRQGEQLLSLKADGTRHHLTMGLGQEPHDGERGDALAAAGLADYPQSLARGHREADPVEYFYLAVVDGELHLEITYLENRGAALAVINGELHPIISDVEDGSLYGWHNSRSLLNGINDVHRSCRAG